ncbi:MAG: DNA adenine methylase [Clostridium sp.]|nr:DNA adenine methylase [Clostridium sp.]MCM1398834.1 DNA adenine methylase [Clostridium sp.]MCM1458535.1 DNA adenine methylase [Bacteroides sp.]
MAQRNKQDTKLKNYSPLRYPGGKSKLASFVSLVIKKTDIKSPIYIEPFAGGAGIALELLFNGTVDEIVINDYDKAIYSMWRAILTNTRKFIELIENTPLNDAEWRKQKNIYITQNKKYSLELGFAAFYLNRTNRSGILSAGPIGGHNQTGNYLIDARFNKDDLIARIKKISKHKQRIHLYNQDAQKFLNGYARRYIKDAFIYFDPPYYHKGKQLYKNYFGHKDHLKIRDIIVKLNCPWMVSYDNVVQIREMYNMYQGYNFDLVYSVANTGLNSEIMFLSNQALVPSTNELKAANIKINFRECT